MAHQKFDLAKIARLDDVGRFDTMKPEAMWDALGNPSPAVIVEIGAGTGLFSAKFASMAPGSTVMAVDTEPAMLEWMREHRPEVAAGTIVPVLGEESAVPLPDSSAQVVVMLNLHHELAEPEAICAEAWRLLQENGQVLVVDWADADTPRGPSRDIRVPAETIASQLRDAGFVAVTVHEGALPWHSMVTGARGAQSTLP